MEKGEKYADQDGLLRSRTAGGHDDCTNVFFYAGIPQRAILHFHLSVV